MLAWKLLPFQELTAMDTSGHLKVSSSAARRVTKAKARRKKSGHGRNGAKTSANGQREPAAVGTLSRTKALLLAALRVWELKQRISSE
jgi:hypothetical protein